MAIDLAALRRQVEAEIENYQYPIGARTVGVPWRDERIIGELALMRSAVVDPYWIDAELRDTVAQIGASPMTILQCVVVADDGLKTLLAFDPDRQEFLLLMRINGCLATIGVRGDAVGCFMSR